MSSTSIITNVSRMASGHFQIKQGDKTYDLSFAGLMIEMGLVALQQSREAFTYQFNAADNLLTAMRELNAVMASLNKIKESFANDAKPGDTKKEKDAVSYKDLMAFNAKYPSLKINITIGSDGTYSRSAVNTDINTIKDMQSSISSLSEQQNSRTTQANSRVTGWLQQIQSLLQSAKDAQQAAGKSGGL